MTLSLISMGVYQRQGGRFRNVLMLRIVGGLLLGLVPLGASFYFAPAYFLGRGVLALTVVYSFVFIITIRVLYLRLASANDSIIKILVLGSGENAFLIREAAKSGELTGLNIVGYVPMPCDYNRGIQSDLIDPDESLVDYVEKKRIDEIVLAADDRRAGLPCKDLLECKMNGVEILDLQTFFERETGKIRLDIMSPSWLYLSDGFRVSLFRDLVKRTFDIVVALLVLPIVLPVIFLVIILIMLESRGRGPFLYQQTRVGLNGKPFQIYKFRSMIPDAEQDGVARWAASNDTRITSVGAFLRKGRLDELPQLYNILKGEMSFIGPRPERPEFVEQLADSIPYYDERHRVKPGLTGWAQIRYPYGASHMDSMNKLQYDLYYVKNYSVFLDLLILLQTAEVVMLGKGA
ncbi:MAG: TIGR03013 family PEP-CTERM/XrtA system glycosyltransferase [Gammaproteobacteria bacterium]|nr:TIGR03013 family PEP-CTERM/XrtA system glycosyltransferase [Gammaproteobacteria bacterium]